MDQRPSWKSWSTESMTELSLGWTWRKDEMPRCPEFGTLSGHMHQAWGKRRNGLSAQAYMSPSELKLKSGGLAAAPGDAFHGLGISVSGGGGGHLKEGLEISSSVPMTKPQVLPGHQPVLFLSMKWSNLLILPTPDATIPQAVAVPRWEPVTSCHCGLKSYDDNFAADTVSGGRSISKCWGLLWPQTVKQFWTLDS